MGFDYALVHVKYTIPPAILLTVLYRPLAARVDVYRVLFLVTVAILATTPWDSYLIRHRVWSYPEDSVIGYTLFRIPFEEVFFFFIQTYIVSLFYLLWSKPELFPLYLIESENERSGLLVNNARRASERRLGQLIICGFLGAGARWLQSGSSGMYMGLILVWSMPVILFLWSLAHLVIVRMPLKTVLVPILAPTIYLWLVDTLALRRGTWVIEQGTKLGWELWPGLEIEEAVFFLLTNILIVFGQIAWDNALAVLESCPSKFPIIPRTPSIPMLVESLILSPNQQEYADIIGLRQAVNRLRRKSRSFFLANAAFRGRLRMDIISLYSYCRVADDLIDEASSREEAKHNFEKLRRYLEIAFQPSATRSVDSERGKFVKAEFPLDTRSALSLLPTPYLSKEPLEAMLDGFETDLAFRDGDSWPIKDQEALELYGLRVAGTVAELCLNLIFYHSPDPVSEQEQQALIASSRTMGVALQTVNIARDIEVDARAGRVYIPTTWLKEHDLAPGDVVKQPDHPAIPQLRKRLLELAWTRYGESRGAIERLPSETRAPLRTAVENYMEIGRVLAEGRYRTREGNATVPLLRRLRTAWKAMNG